MLDDISTAFDDAPSELAFDDEALDRLLYGAEGPGPTPANVLEAWRQRGDLPEEWRKAAVAVLVNDPEKGKSLLPETLATILDQEVQAMAHSDADDPREVLNLARLHHAAQRFDQAEAGYRRVLAVTAGRAALPQDERWRAMNYLADLLDHAGKTEDATELQALSEAEQMLSDPSARDLVPVRSLALSLFVAGRYESCERLYRGLLARRFQEPGTWVHLARALLVQDRVAEARQATAKAWKCMRLREGLEETLAYVRPRIFFLRILYAMLAERPYARLLVCLKRELRASPEQVLWTITPAIERIRSDLAQADGELLTAIAEAINAADKIDALDAFPAWAAGEQRGKGLSEESLPASGPA